MEFGDIDDFPWMQEAFPAEKIRDIVQNSRSFQPEYRDYGFAGDTNEADLSVYIIQLNDVRCIKKGGATNGRLKTQNTNIA